MGTVPSWFSGKALPQRFEDLSKLLEVLGVTEEDELDKWRTALDRLRGNPALPPSPFPGMVPFKEEEASNFCGRRALRKELSKVVDAEFEGTGTGTRVVVVFGVSGAGKSSVLRAGLHAQRPHASLITPEDQPQARLEKAIAELESAPQGQQLLIIDQCEELWTQQRNDDDAAGRRRRERFLDELRRWLAGGNRVAVIGLPAAYLADAVGDPLFPGGERSRQVLVGPMSRAELTEAIRGPVEHTTGVEIEDALVETLLDELDADEKTSEVGALPVLAYVLAQTWEAMERRVGEHRVGERVLTVKDYLSTGGIRGAVAKDADAIYEGFSASQQETARRVMLSAVVVTFDSQARARVRREKLKWDDIDDSDIDVVVESYLDKRLLVADSSGFQISHEALLRAWPRLREWIAMDRESHRLSRQLSEEATEWEKHERRNRYLLSRGRTEDYEKWLKGKPTVEIGQDEQQYLQASRRRHTQRSQRRKLVVMTLTILLVAALGAAGWASLSAAEARQARNESLSRQAALQWELQRERDSALAQAIALAGYRVDPTLEARSALLDSTAVPVPHRSPTVDGPMSSALSSDGALLAVCNSDGNVRVFRTDTPGHPPIATFAASAGSALYAVAFRPGTRQLAVGGRQGAQVWDVSNPAASSKLLALPGTSGKVENLAWSPEGSELAAAADTVGTLRWNITPEGKTVTTTMTLPPTGPAGGRIVSAAVAYSPDGALLATAGGDSSVELWDRRSDRNSPLAQLALNGSKTLDLTFDHSSAKLAVGTNNDEALIIDVRDPVRPTIVQRAGGFDSWINTVAFSSDGLTLAAGSSDNTIRLFDVGATDNPPARHVLTGRAVVTSLHFHGSDLISAAQDGFVRTWPLPGPISTSLGSGVRTLTGNSDGTIVIASGLRTDRIHQFHITASGELVQRGPELPFTGLDRSSGASTVSLDGRVAAAGTDTRSVYTWDITDPSSPRQLSALPNVTSSAAAALVFTPDSRYLFVGGGLDGKQISVIDRSDPTQPEVVKTFEASNRIQLLSVSTDGRYLVASTASEIQLWDIADGPGNPEALPDHPGFGANVSAVRFAGHDLLAAGSNEGTVRLYRASDTGLHELAAVDGPTGQIQSLAFSADNTRLAAGTSDGQVWVWDVSDPARPSELAVLSAHGKSVNDVVYGPSGHHFTAAGDAAVLQVWLTDVEAVADALCQYPAAQITEEEWNRYLPGTSYQPPCD